MNWSDMSPRERDALVAEKVMGWKRGTGYHTVIVPGPFDHCDCTSHDEEPPAFTDDIACAWEVVVEVSGNGACFLCGRYAGWAGLWGAEFFVEETGERIGLSRGEATAPEAICLAALRAVGAIDG